MLLAALALPGVARANGDPCSDQLTISDICVPSGSNLPASATKGLAQALTDSTGRGTQIKVAVIANPGDLGLIPQLFGKPQPYARFLGQEISYNYDGILLVVMKQGYGVFHGRQPIKREVAAMQALPPPTAGTPAALIAASVKPVKRLAQLEGAPKKSGGGSTRTWVIVGIAAAVLLAIAAAGAEYVRTRRKRA